MRYYVSQHFDGNLSAHVEAESEEEALEKFKKEFYNDAKSSRASEFLEWLGLMEGEIEVYEDDPFEEVKSK